MSSIRAGRSWGSSTVSEVFADRTYRSDGTLTPRSQPDAARSQIPIVDPQSLRMIQAGRVRHARGTTFPIQADTVCLHGDGPRAVVLARQIRERLESEGIVVRACRAPVARLQ